MKAEGILSRFAIIIVLSGFYNLIVNAQDTTYYNAQKKKVNSIELCDYYRIEIANNKGILRKEYYKSGSRKEQSFYERVAGDHLLRTGTVKTWYKNGNLKYVRKYNQHGLNGEMLTYWDNGQLKRVDLYANGNLSKGKCWKKNGDKDKYKKIPFEPSFKGGSKGWEKYLSKNVRYPYAAKHNGIEGRVLVKFKISTKGKVYDVEVAEHAHEYLDKEAVRVVKEMPDWIPGEQDGQKINAVFYFPIRFKL